jgi:hypothetical protein
MFAHCLFHLFEWFNDKINCFKFLENGTQANGTEGKYY